VGWERVGEQPKKAEDAAEPDVIDTEPATDEEKEDPENPFDEGEGGPKPPQA
jgi:hypothetical protein